MSLVPWPYITGGVAALGLLAAGTAAVQTWRADRAIQAIDAPAVGHANADGSTTYTGGWRARYDVLERDRAAILERAARCDTALNRGDEYAVSTACSLAVKTVSAQRDARAAEVSDRDATITRLRTDQAAAAARAEARGREQTRRTTDARQAIQGAPVGGDGLRGCDAECLRRLG